MRSCTAEAERWNWFRFLRRKPGHCSLRGRNRKERPAGYFRKDQTAAFLRLARRKAHLNLWMDRMTRLTPLAKASEDGAEKRCYPRYHIDAPTRATVRCQGALKVVHGRANNLSEGGMAAQLPVELVIGESIQVEVVLPYCSEALKLRAVVRNRRSYLYGVEFSRISAAQADAIRRACHSLALLQ